MPPQTIEVQRGRRVVARVVPVQPDEARRTRWVDHRDWFEAAARPAKRRQKDPVDELLESRRRRDAFR